MSILQSFGGGPGSGFYQGFDANSIYGYGNSPQSGLAALGLGQVPGGGQAPPPGMASPINQQFGGGASNTFAPTMDQSSGMPGPFQPGYTGAGFQPGQPGYGYGVLAPGVTDPGYDPINAMPGFGNRQPYQPYQSVQNPQSAYAPQQGAMSSSQSPSPQTASPGSQQAPPISMMGYQMGPPHPASPQSSMAPAPPSPMQNLMSRITYSPQSSNGQFGRPNPSGMGIDNPLATGIYNTTHPGQAQPYQAPIGQNTGLLQRAIANNSNPPQPTPGGQPRFPIRNY